MTEVLGGGHPVSFLLGWLAAMPPDRMAAMPPDPLAVYTALWGISTQLEHIKARCARADRGSWVCCCCAWRPLFSQRRTLAALAFSMRCVWWLNRWPFMWASETIGGLTDLAIVWHLMLADVDRSSASQLTAGLGFSIRRQLAGFTGLRAFGSSTRASSTIATAARPCSLLKYWTAMCRHTY